MIQLDLPMSLLAVTSVPLVAQRQVTIVARQKPEGFETMQKAACAS